MYMSFHIILLQSVVRSKWI